MAGVVASVAAWNACHTLLLWVIRVVAGGAGLEALAIEDVEVFLALWKSRRIVRLGYWRGGVACLISMVLLIFILL